jgi:hypothetical protein
MQVVKAQCEQLSSVETGEGQKKNSQHSQTLGHNLNLGTSQVK